MALSGVTVMPEPLTAPVRSAASSSSAEVMTSPPPLSWMAARGEGAGGLAPPNQFDQKGMGILSAGLPTYSTRMLRLS